MSGSVAPASPHHAGGPEHALGRALNRRDLAWAALIGVLAMGVALVYRSALVPTDPWQYVQGALAFPEPWWRPAGMSRWGFLLPIVPFARLWADSTATYYVVPLLSTGALAGVLYLLGTRFVARTAGVVGALAALGTPLVFVNLTRGYPDLTATMLVGSAILLATLAQDRARAADAQGRVWGWPVALLLMACGFVTGWSFEVRETAVFAWPVIAWILWGLGRPARTLAWFAPPALAWLVLDLWLCARIYGDPWLKLRVFTGADISTSVVPADSVYVGHSRWWYATILPRSIWEVSGGPALLACLVVGLVGGVLFRAQLARIWAWGVLAFGLLWLQGGPLDPGHPSVRLDVARYWLSFMVPLLLAAVCTLVIAVRRSRGPARAAAVLASVALAAGVAVPAVRFATTYPGFAPNGGDAMAELRDHLAETGGMPDSRVWADWGTQRVLPAYQNGPFGDPRWSAARFYSITRLLRTRPSDPAKYPQPGDYVVLYSDGDRTCWQCRVALKPAKAAFGPFPAEGWELLFTSSAGNLRLFQLGPDSTWPLLPEAGGTAGLDPDPGATSPPDVDTGDPDQPDSSADEDATVGP